MQMSRAPAEKQLPTSPDAYVSVPPVSAAEAAEAKQEVSAYYASLGGTQNLKV